MQLLKGKILVNKTRVNPAAFVLWWFNFFLLMPVMKMAERTEADESYIVQVSDTTNDHQSANAGPQNFYFKANLAASPNASGTKLMLGRISSSGFQSKERLSGMF